MRNLSPVERTRTAKHNAPETAILKAASKLSGVVSSTGPGVPKRGIVMQNLGLTEGFADECFGVSTLTPGP
jgi:hypothetical protein